MKDQRGPKNSRWKGGRTQSRGYVYLRERRHPVSPYFAEHRAVAEQAIGRPLGPDEVVHHIDGDEGNNEPANLRVMSRSEHMRLHMAATAMRGERHPNARLSDDRVRELWRLHRRGQSQRAIGAELGISAASVGNVLRGRTWAHIAPEAA